MVTTTEERLYFTYAGKQLLVPADFINHSHPGGKDIVMQYNGKDITKAFDAADHSMDAVQMMEEWQSTVPEAQQAELQARAERRRRAEEEWRWRSTFIAFTAASIVALIALRV